MNHLYSAELIAITEQSAKDQIVIAAKKIGLESNLSESELDLLEPELVISESELVLSEYSEKALILSQRKEKK